MKEIPKEIEELCRAWYKYFHRWWIAHYTFGALATACSITVASHPHFLQTIPYFIDIVAWLAAVCIALIVFLMPSRRARAYVAAWRLLCDACNRYKIDDNYQIKELLDAVKEGEKIIASSDPY